MRNRMILEDEDLSVISSETDLSISFQNQEKFENRLFHPFIMTLNG